MVALSQDDGFVDVTRVETSDVALGGNEINVPNKQFVELASRDQWLKDELESRTGSDATAIASFERNRDLSQASIAQGRLTLATGDPTPSGDITAATTLYYTPYNGDLVSLYNSPQTRWDVYQFTERSLSLSGLGANANYDIFLYDNAGTLTLEAVGWSNSGAGTSARASAISRRNGVWVKTSDDRRYLGSIRTTGVAGQCEDTADFAGIWNVQNQIRKNMLIIVNEGSYTYSTQAWRRVFGVDTYRLQVIAGLEQSAKVDGQAIITQTGISATGVGVNSVSANSSQLYQNAPGINTDLNAIRFSWIGSLAGFNYLQQLEWGHNTSGVEPNASFLGSYEAGSLNEGIGRSGMTMEWNY